MGAPSRTPGAIHTSERAERAAKRLRREATLGERQVWKQLRESEHHFRRQAPMGPYVVDFVCHAARLIVEVDGPHHDRPETAAKDKDREAWLKGRNYRILRFSDREATFDAGTVVQRILGEIGAGAPTPNPSPQGGGEL